MTTSLPSPPTLPMPADDFLRAIGMGLGETTLLDRMDIVVHEATTERLVATMPVAGNTQPFGLLHGGASCVLAETLGSIGAGLHAGDEAQAVGVEINATHHRSAREGLVTGVATPIHLGRSLVTYEIAITGENGERLCTARLTCTLLRRSH